MAKKKPIIHDTKTCRDVGVFEIHYDDNNTPWLQCTSCGKVMDDWIRWRESYSSFWQDPLKWESKKDHLVCLLGYFTDKYKSHYGIPYTFSLNDRGLFNGPEIFCIRKMYAMLNNDALLSKDYIDWIFENKVIKKNKKITSLSFLAVPDLIQEFRFSKSKSRRITRDRLLPEKMLQWISENTPEVLSMVSLRDFGELRIALSAFKAGNLGDAAQFSKFVDKLMSNNVIDADLNIVGWSE